MVLNLKNVLTWFFTKTHGLVTELFIVKKKWCHYDEATSEFSKYKPVVLIGLIQISLW